MNNKQNFGEWLQAELNYRGWSHKELSRRIDRCGGKLSPARIDQIVAGDAPSYGAVQDIARAIGVGEVDALKAAGMLAAAPEGDVSFVQLYERVSKLTPAQREDVDRILDAMIAAENARRATKERAGGREGSGA